MLEKMLALQNKRKKEGGFTLVELIVVLVILAILAALLIPALTGYINRAKEKNVIAETRQCVMAAQTLYDEAYAAGTVKKGEDVTSSVAATDVTALAEVKGTIATEGDKKMAFKDGKLTHLEYTEAGTNGITCTYNGSTYSVPTSK